jgi:hypothetical protein
MQCIMEQDGRMINFMRYVCSQTLSPARDGVFYVGYRVASEPVFCWVYVTCKGGSQ